MRLDDDRVNEEEVGLDEEEEVVGGAEEER